MHLPLRTKLILLPALALVVTVGLTACGSSSTSAKPAGGDIAVVGKTHVLLSDFNDLLAQAKASFKQQKRAFPTVGSTAYETLKSQAVGLLVGAAEREQKAESLGVIVKPDAVCLPASGKQKETCTTVQQRLDAIKKQYFGGSEKKYQAQLKVQGLTDHLVRFDIKAQLVSEAVQTMLTKGIVVSAADVHAYYVQNAATYTQPQSRDVRHILVKSKALAEKLYAQLKSGQDKIWCADAKKYSQDPSSKDKCGQLTDQKGSFVPEFEKVAFSQPTKVVHPPIQSKQYGWFIIEPLANIKPRTTTPEKTVAAAIKAQLVQQKVSAAVTSWASGVTKDYCTGSSKVRYQAGYAPTGSNDPCAALTTTAATTT